MTALPPLGRPRAKAAVAFSLLLLAGGYAWLAVEAGRPWIGAAIVHESGRYTFVGTVLYFAHFLREVPIALVYALFAVAAVGAPIDRDPAAVGTRRRLAAVALAAALALIALAFLAAARADGAGSAARDLLQHRTRDDLSAWGSHWRFHLLSTVWAGVAAPVVAWGIGVRCRDGTRLRLAAWGWVALATLVFGVSTDVVADPRYVGHQAREIATAGLVFLPLTVGTLAWIRGEAARPAPGPGALPDGLPAARRPSAIGIGLAVAIPLYLAGATLALGSMEAAHDAPLAALVAGHAFEHALDLAFVLLSAVGLQALLARRLTRGGSAPGTRTATRPPPAGRGAG